MSSPGTSAIRGTVRQAKIWLSHSGLETLERCPRCFWLQYNRRIYQPEGIVSRLANRFDVLVKQHFGQYRGTAELPPVIAGKVAGVLEHPFQEEYFAPLNDRYGFKGKLDECLVTPAETHTPVDHKTSSSDPRAREDTLPAYQAQLDSYAFLLEKNRKPTSGIGHLIYYYPDATERLHEGVKLAVVVKTLETDPIAALHQIERGIEALEGPMPQPSDRCPFCGWREKLDALG